MHSTPKTKANNLITEDGQKDFEEEVQTFTNKFTKRVDELAVAKEADLMKVWGPAQIGLPAIPSSVGFSTDPI